MIDPDRYLPPITIIYPGRGFSTYPPSRRSASNALSVFIASDCSKQQAISSMSLVIRYRPALLENSECMQFFTIILAMSFSFEVSIITVFMSSFGGKL